MRVKELIEKLQKYNQDAEINVVVHNKKEKFSLTWSGSEGTTKEKATSVSFYVDRLCDNETQGKEAIITEVDRLRKELTAFYQRDNQEHRLIAKIERLEEEKDTLKEEVERLSKTTGTYREEVVRLRELVRVYEKVVKFIEEWVERPEGYANYSMSKDPSWKPKLRKIGYVRNTLKELRTKIAEIEKEPK